MTTSIPASVFVNVIPSVLQPGGNPLSLNAVFITEDTSPPIGSVLAFPNAAAVAAWFGANSNQAALGNVYFNGFSGADQLPGNLYFAQYNPSAVAAYLRGGSVGNLTLAQLQALSGTITIAVNGVTLTSAAINLAGVTSQSLMAGVIEIGLQTTGNAFAGTASTSGSSETLTIASTVSGSLAVGDTITGSGIPGSTTITAFGTYTIALGTGTVALSQAATVSSATPVDVTLLPTVTYDTLRQAFVITSPTTGALSTIAYPTDSSLSPSLFLTSATGAVLSQGAAASTPAATMNLVVAATQNWATFMTDFLPSPTVMLQFAAWANAQNQRFLYVAYDNNAAAQSPNASASFGVETANYNGVCAIWNPSGLIAAFVCGTIASIDFEQTNGRLNLAWKSQAGLQPDITSATVYENLVGNFYNSYVSIASNTQKLQNFQNGQMSGNWSWIDPYVNQIYWNAAFQAALLSLLTQVKSIPYNSAGYNMIRTTLQPVIAAMGNFGGWVPGVVLSGAQIAAVNAMAGVNIAQTLQNVGNYLQVKDPGPIVRGERGTPIINFWYCDGGSVNLITMDSIDIE